MIKVVIVLPTYNERDNIRSVLEGILRQKYYTADVRISVLVVDDMSPDGTAEIVRELARIYPNVHLIQGRKEGLGIAYVRGFSHAIHNLGADIVFEMDADLSHDPNDIPRFLSEILKGYDLVIGSRYIPGGSIPQNWGAFRKANSKWGNVFARHIAALKPIKDCTSGFRAMRADVLRNIDFTSLGIRGYAFQISLLHAIKSGRFLISEIPINFTDRSTGKSKLKIKDIFEFMAISLSLGLSRYKKIFFALYVPLMIAGVLSLLWLIFFFQILSSRALLILFIVCMPLLLSLQRFLQGDLLIFPLHKEYSSRIYSYLADNPASFVFVRFGKLKSSCLGVRWGWENLPRQFRIAQTITQLVEII